MKGIGPVDRPFDCVAVVVRHDDDRCQPLARQRSQFLNGELSGAVADQQHDASVPFGQPGAKQRAISRRRLGRSAARETATGPRRVSGRQMAMSGSPLLDDRL